ncbi:hypothetical protein M9H77_22416 [Catharanthus roseus]|uniref:Uncharacterized protein n=1 Tax=Catharanthus roseus TaxID=4058 RepID=A0ACC0AT14_CATRO|nr:hypothetical protein M9H77_22416 [Catharanthus roseus]
MPERVIEDDGSPLSTSSSVMLAGDSNNSEVSQNIFEKYELGKLLGCGAFAKVYHARDLRTGQSVAIKAVSKQRILKGNLTGHVKREISIMHRLRHPNIVRLHEVLATKSKIYFVMEFAKGGELFAKVAKGRFSEDLSRRYFQQLISAVGYCHSRGVYHRDLKPENLLLDENWDLKVTDFGLSAVTDQIRPDGLLHTLCGTPAYVAPEILAKKGYDGAKVDIWSCGVILYVLNAGYLPFNDTNLMAMYRKIYKGEFRCPKWTSPELKRFLSRLLDTNPSTRITIDEIMDDPWFNRDGFKDRKVSQLEREYELLFKDGFDNRKEFLNAFDIISLSPGFDLSGMFRNDGVSLEGERFVSLESPETIVRRFEEVAKEEKVRATRTKNGVRLEGYKGDFIWSVDIFRLTEELVVVEIKRRESGIGTSIDLWKHKFRPGLNNLVYELDRQIIRN